MGVRYIVSDLEFDEQMTFRTLKEAVADAQDCELAKRGFVVWKETFRREDISSKVAKKFKQVSSRESSDG